MVTIIVLVTHSCCARRKQTALKESLTNCLCRTQRKIEEKMYGVGWVIRRMASFKKWLGDI